MRERSGIIIVGVVIAALLLVGCGAMGGNQPGAPSGSQPGGSEKGQQGGQAGSPAPTPENLTNDNWGLASQDADKYKGANVILEGEVFNVLPDSDGFHHFQIYTDPSAGQGNTHVSVKEDPRVKKGYQVRITGTVRGALTTKAVSGKQLKIPEVEAQTVEITGPPDVITPTATSAPTATPTPTKVPTVTPTPNPPTGTPTVAPSPSPTSAPSASPSPTTAPSPSPSATARPSASPTPPAAPSASPSPSAAATASPTTAVTPSPSAVPPSPSAAPAPSPSAEPTGSPPPVATSGGESSGGPGTVVSDLGSAQLSGAMAVGSDSGAAGGRYIYSTVSDTGWDGKGNPPPTGQAAISVEVPHDGSYAVWAHMWYDNVNANSYWLIIDNQPAIRVGNEDSGYRQWKWVGWHDSPNSRITVELTAGTHTVRLIGRESGARVDRVLVTDDLNNTPQ